MPDLLEPGADEVYRRLRPLLFSIAYRMLGSVSEAEDIVQEAFLRYHAVGAGVASAKAYLCAITTNLCIDQLRSARVRREAYPGTWLPEPLLTGPAEPADPADPAAADPAAEAEQADSLSMAFLLLLERLSPIERAIFLLHEVFGFGYGEIAGIVGRKEEYCRQLARRARAHLAENRPRFEAARRRRDELAAAFFRAVQAGDVDGLVGMLAADVVVQGDGGGTGPSWTRPIAGRERVARLLAVIGRQAGSAGVRFGQVEINGQPGAMLTDSSGGVINVLVLDIADGQVVAVRSVINPDKLRHLGPLSRLPGLRRGAGPDQTGAGAPGPAS